MKEMGILILTIIILTSTVLLSLFFSSIGLAATNSTQIYVNVSSIGQLSVTPQALSWTQIAPGSNGTDQTIIITNTGSTTLTNLYTSVNSFALESTNPVGTNDRTKYSSGSFLVLKNTSDVNYHFVNRMEWNDSNIAPTGKSANSVSWGFYYNKTQKWLWELVKDGGNNCSTAGGLKIQTTEGSYVVGSTAANPIANSTTFEWSSWNFTNGPLVDYCIAVKWDCTRLMIYRWDYNTSLPTCTIKTYLNTTLAVGASIYVTANVFVPSGIPSGDIGTSNSTLLVTAT